MARSQYIWVVFNTHLQEDGVAATFTVKHEMNAWLKKPGNEGRTWVRYPDGAPREKQ